MSGTLAIYITRRFALEVVAMLAALSILFALFDFIELLRRAATHPEATLVILTKITVLHLPWTALQLLPFAILLGGITCFWRLNRTSELVVIRATGMSAWQFLAAPVGAAVLMGAFATLAISPISSACYNRAEQLDNHYIRDSEGTISLEGGEIWLRQDDSALLPDGSAIVHGHKVGLIHGKLVAGDVSMFRLDNQDRLIERVEAANAVLEDGYWDMVKAHEIKPDQSPGPLIVHLPVATDLTLPRVQQSFASPDTLSVWALPAFIRLMEQTGFSSVRHRLHFQTLLALPLLAGTMALVAAGFSMRPIRRGGVARMLSGGVTAGFVLFAFSKFAAEFGSSGALPALLAAWAPAAAGLLLAISLLLHLEDG